MEPYARLGGPPQPTITLYQGHVLDVLAALPAQRVHCVVTSPPYFALRDYGTGTWVGGESGCAHRLVPAPTLAKQVATSTLTGGKKTVGHQQQGYGALCGRCGASRVDQQLGLETRMDCNGAFTGEPCGGCYICRMVAVFDAVGRVLRDEGCAFLNIGDSYAGSGKGFGGADHGKLGPQAHAFLPPPMPLATFRPGAARADGQVDARAIRNRNGTACPPGLKPKDLCLVPARLALALQAAGWYVRSELVWHKLNPLPESVTDRPTKAHELVYLLTKSPRYWYDAVAVREPAVKGAAGSRFDVGKTGVNGNGRVQEGYRDHALGQGRSMRSVLSLASEPFPGAHFATFPQQLITPFILAGCPARCCAVCGAGWVRVVERSRTHNGVRRDDLGAWRNTDPGCPIGAQGDGHWRYATVTTTQGFQPGCACNAGVTAGTVLDPFCGSGTTALVAMQHGRHSIGVDLSATYLDLAVQRLTPALQQLPLFAPV